MSTFCQRSYHRKCQRRGVGGQKKAKILWMPPKACVDTWWILRTERELFWQFTASQFIAIVHGSKKKWERTISSCFFTFRFFFQQQNQFGFSISNRVRWVVGILTWWWFFFLIIASPKWISSGELFVFCVKFPKFDFAKWIFSDKNQFRVSKN